MGLKSHMELILEGLISQGLILEGLIKTRFGLLKNLTDADYRNWRGL